MPINPNIALMPMQGVKDQGNAINNGFNAYYQAQGNKRQNALFDMQQQNNTANQEKQNALFGMQQGQDARSIESHEFKMDQAKGQMLYKSFQALSQLDPELRAAQIELMKPGLMANGFDDDDWEMLKTDEGIKQGLGVLSKYVPQAKAEIGRHKVEKLPDGSVISFDSATNTYSRIADPESVDLSVLPENVRADVENLPLATQKEIVKQYASPKGQESIKTAEEKEQKGKELKDRTFAMINELLGNESGVKSALGGIDSMTPTFLDSTKDAEAGLDDLRNLLTVENLGIMSGVLSETDMNIIRSIGASGLSGSQDRVISRLKEMRTALGGESFQQEATNEPKQIGRYRVKVGGQ